MKKRIVLYGIVFCSSLTAMNSTPPEVKIAWSYPLIVRDMSVVERDTWKDYLACSENQKCVKNFYGRPFYGTVSSWTLHNNRYDPYIVIPLDAYENECHYCDFKSHEFIYNPEQCLAVVLRDKCRGPLETLDEQWYVYAILQIMYMSNASRSIEVRLLKKLPRFNTGVISVCNMPHGNNLIFFLVDGSIKIIAPDEVKAPRIMGTRCERWSDLFFEFL